MTSHPTADSPEVNALAARAAALQQRGALTEAQSLLSNALQSAPGHPTLCTRLGHVLLDLKRPAEAAPLFQIAVTARPDDADARFALAVALLETGNAKAAAPVFLKASRIAPAWVAPRLMLAKCMTVVGRAADALNILRQTSQDMPTAPEVWMQRGNLERELNDNAAAEYSYRRYLDLAPEDASALNNLGVAVRAQNRLAEAIEIYGRALALSPASGLAHANLGNALDAAGRATEAEKHLREAVALMPGSGDAAYNLAVHLIREEKPDSAIPLLRHILGTAPSRWDAWTNLGVGLVAVGEMKEAEACYRTSLRLWPTAPETHYNLAWLLLLTGQWNEGWTEYEWRWQLPNFSSSKRAPTTPRWDGAAHPQATILLQAEQGLGDTIQFVRLATLVRARCGRVILECPKSLIPLLIGTNGIDAIVAAGEPFPPHDFHLPLLSVPGAVGLTPQSIPSPEGYLAAPTSAKPNLTLPKSNRKKIGFVWAGSPDNKIDRRRSCDVSHFSRLMQGVDADFVSLQTGPRASDLQTAAVANLIFNIEGQVADWADTAALIGQLDLVIGVDTAVAHLAGALGKPCWILLPSSPDFRWLLGQDTTPWYSSVLLFRQRVRADWGGVFADLESALTLWLRPRPSLNALE